MKYIYSFLLAILFCPQLFAAEYTYNPSQLTALKTALNGKLSPGDIVYLADGIYTDFQVTFKGEGTSAKPITLKAKNPGKVILTGQLNIKMSGNYLVVDGLVLKDGMAAKNDIIEFRTNTTTFANYSRLTNIVIDNCNNPDPKYVETVTESERWVMVYGKNNRVDHCYFTNKTNGGVLLMVNIDNVNSRENNHVIDYNFFADRPRFALGNNAETVRLGDSKSSQYSCQTTVENNFFYACDGEVEIISIKSCDNIIRNNSFYESEGGVVCRHGHRNIIESNAFIGNNKKSCGGVRIINQGHRVYNNYFQDLEGLGNKSALCVMMGIFEKPTESTDLQKDPLNTYHRVKDVDICYNTFVNCRNIDLGTEVKYTYPSDNPYYPGKTIYGTLKPECNIDYNIVYNPTSNKVLNLIGTNASDIKYANNLYTLKTAPGLSGFYARNLIYNKTASGYGKGFYIMTNTDNGILSPPGSTGTNYNYVTHDISGNIRNGVKSVGSQQQSYLGKAFSVVSPSKAGVDWYQSQLDKRETIKKKTDFWEDMSSGISDNKISSDIEINDTGNKIFSIISQIPIIDMSILNLSGKVVLNHKIGDYSATINCQGLSAGVYFFHVKTIDGYSVRKKLI